MGTAAGVDGALAVTWTLPGLAQRNLLGATPTQCSRGHRLEPGRVLVGASAVLMSRRAHELDLPLWRNGYAPPVDAECRVLHGAAAVR